LWNVWNRGTHWLIDALMLWKLVVLGLIESESRALELKWIRLYKVNDYWSTSRF